MRNRQHWIGSLAIATSVMGMGAGSALANSILFVGNSFTYGEPAGGMPVVEYYQPSTVTDLNGTGIGGVPALFKEFTVEAGLNYNVSLETVGGKGVDYHYNNKLSLITQQPWNDVVLQSYSTLDATHPGNPAVLIQYSGLLAQAFQVKNPDVRVLLDSTWTRADQTYQISSSPWYGKPIDAMYKDVQAGYIQADLQNNAAHPGLIDGVIPVGAAFNQAIQTGFAAVNPYKPIPAGKVNIWAPDSYHASPFGYYLEALTEFLAITGEDPRMLGGNELAAAAIGINASQAVILQNIAYDNELLLPEPAAIAALAPGLLVLLRRRRSAA